MKCYSCKDEITKNDYFTIQKRDIAYTLYFHPTCFDIMAGREFGATLLQNYSAHMCLLCGEKPSPNWKSKACDGCSAKAPMCNQCSMPSGSTQMVLRTTKSNTIFWGCANYPRCRGINNI